jgi:hypothetical protein
VPLFYLTLVFPERDIPYPMQPVFDAPVTTPMAKQKRRSPTLTRNTADGVLNFDRRASLAASRAFETANLRQTGPIEMPGQPCTGLQMPLNRAAMPLGRFPGFRERCLSLVFGRGGKNRAENPLPRRPSTRADCPSPRTDSRLRYRRFADITRVGKTWRRR